MSADVIARLTAALADRYRIERELGAERFLAEIKVTANLQHPHLLPLFDSGEASGLLFYVMPFVEGETLPGSSGRSSCRWRRPCASRSPSRRHSTMPTGAE